MAISDFNIMNWGAVPGTDPANAATNDAAFVAAIASGTAVIYIPQLFTISSTITLTNRAITLIGSNPYAPDAGGLLVTGGGTAQSASVITITDAAMHRIENLRFYGHDSAIIPHPDPFPDPTSQLRTNLVQNCILAQYDSGNPTDFNMTGLHINHCMFADRQKNVKSFQDVITLHRVAAEGNTDYCKIDHCMIVGFMGIGIHVFNTQSVGWMVNHCFIDGRADLYANFATHGLLTRANGSVRESHVNRCQIGHEINQSSNVVWDNIHVEHTRHIIKLTDQDVRMQVRGGKWILHNDAYTGAVDDGLRTISHRGEQLWMKGVDCVNNVTPEVPHLFLGSGATSNPNDIFFDNCEYWQKSDIIDDVAVGDPNQFFENDNGIRLRWRDSSGSIDTYIPSTVKAIEPLPQETVYITATPHTLTAADTAKLFVVEVADCVINLPPTAAGLWYCIMVKTLSTVTGCSISPDNADNINGAADGLNYINTAATDAVGDQVAVVANGTSGWDTQDQIGIWVGE
jgi:hypothetical protein